MSHSTDMKSSENLWFDQKTTGYVASIQWKSCIFSVCIPWWSTTLVECAYLRHTTELTAGLCNPIMQRFLTFYLIKNEQEAILSHSQIYGESSLNTKEDIRVHLTQKKIFRDNYYFHFFNLSKQIKLSGIKGSFRPLWFLLCGHKQSFSVGSSNVWNHTRVSK